MASSVSNRVEIVVNETTRVSGLFERPRRSRLCIVVAHGAGAGMEHPFMATLADDLALRNIATLRYQFPYIERADKWPDDPPLCHATVRAAVTTARHLAPHLPLIAGGKSFGGRMTSQAQSTMPLPGVLGLVFFGFPLQQPNKPSIERAAHLSEVKIPMLFIQGTRDAHTKLNLLRPLVDRLQGLGTLNAIYGADHFFRVLKRSGRTQKEVRVEMVESFLAWSTNIANGTLDPTMSDSIPTVPA